MANNAYFQIPADDVGRSRKFYESLLGWKILIRPLWTSPCNGRISSPVNQKKA